MPYPALNSAFDALYPPGGLQHYWKANFVRELTDDAIDAHLEHGPKVPVVNSTVHIYPINGACHRVAPDDTAFAYRDATFATVIAGMWPDPADNEANIKWVRDYYDAVAPLSEEGGYVNFMSGDDQDRIKANYKGQLRPADRGQAEVRPRQPVPPEPEHPAVVRPRAGDHLIGDGSGDLDLHDRDRGAERHEPGEAQGVGVAQADAPVGDPTGDQVGPVGAVDAVTRLRASP